MNEYEQEVYNVWLRDAAIRGLKNGSAMDGSSHLLTPEKDDAHVGATTVFKLPGTTVMLERPDAVTWRHVFFMV